MVSGSNPLVAISFMTDFLDAIRVAIAKHRMLRRGDRVLVAVSGGPDSLALLSVLVVLREELRVTLRAVYVDHRLRPAAARKEAALVKRLGLEWGVPVAVLRRLVQQKKEESLETAARRIRYEALTALARSSRCAAIATGHTADDQAETVLMRILRGAGITGLAGIPPVRRADPAGKIRLIRPLIHLTRAEVKAHLRSQKIRPLLDRSNLSVRFLRNRIRRNLLADLEKINPQVRRHLARMAELAREDLDWMKAEAAGRFRLTARVQRASVRLDRVLLRKDPPALRRAVLRLAAERLQGSGQGFALRHWELLDRLLVGAGTGAADLPHRFRAVAENGVLRLSRSPCPSTENLLD